MGPRRTLSTLFLIVFTDLVGFGIVIPLLPLYAEHFHPSAWVFGLLMASYSAMQFVFSPVLGRLSDRIGRRPVLLVSLAGSIAGYVLFALAGSMTVLFASRLIAGLCGANIATAQAVIADTTPPEGRARGMGLIGAAFGLGFIAGPALAGVLLQLSVTAPGWGAASFSAIAFGMALAFLPETRRAGGESAAPRFASPFARLARGWADRRLAPLLLLGFLIVTGFAGFEVTFAQFLHGRLDLPNDRVSFMFVYVGVLAAIVQGGLMGRLSRRYGEARLVMAGLLSITVGLTALAATHRLWPLLAILVVVSFGAGVVTPSLTSLVSRSAGHDEQGAALGAFQSVGSLARVVGPFSAEVALGRWGVGAPAAFAAGLALIAAVAALRSLFGEPAGA
jgi:DHA1 family tetracycline resistance protein-like MFS transporter